MNMAHYASFITSVRYLRDNLLGFDNDGGVVCTQGLNHLWRQFNFEWQRRLERCHEFTSFFRIVEHDDPRTSLGRCPLQSRNHTASPERRQLRRAGGAGWPFSIGFGAIGRISRFSISWVRPTTRRKRPWQGSQSSIWNRLEMWSLGRKSEIWNPCGRW